MDDNSIAINLSNGTILKYFCSHCNTSLIPLTQEDKIGGYLSTKFTIEYWPNQTSVKKADKFDLPGSESDQHGNVIGDKDILIAMIDENNKECLQLHINNRNYHPRLKR
jgi:hypothetical protein